VNAGRPFIVAIDGPAGSGKGTVATALAQRLDFAYFESGIFFRVVSWRALQLGVRPEQNAELEALIASPWLREQWQVLDRTLLREEHIGMFSSEIGKNPGVRALFISFVHQEISKETAKGVILDGRDTGSAVFPDADCKIFLTASSEVRAHRRFDELRARGKEVVYEEIFQDLHKRDANDRSRPVGPLQIDDTYCPLDTSNLSIAEAISAAERIVRQKYLHSEG
jgi:cytidylate kinase